MTVTQHGLNKFLLYLNYPTSAFNFSLKISQVKAKFSVLLLIYEEGERFRLKAF